MSKFRIVTLLCIFLSLIYSGIVLSKQNNLCFEDEAAIWNESAKVLRAIAAECKNKQLMQLYYNRAYHKDLLQEGAVLANIIVQQNDSVQHHLSSYRMYIAMIEEFAPKWFPDLLQRAQFLNNIYEKRGEVVELRLHGYDKSADILEREMLLTNN